MRGAVMATSSYDTYCCRRGLSNDYGGILEPSPSFRSHDYGVILEPSPSFRLCVSHIPSTPAVRSSTKPASFHRPACKRSPAAASLWCINPCSRCMSRHRPVKSRRCGSHSPRGRHLALTLLYCRQGLKRDYGGV